MATETVQFIGKYMSFTAEVPSNIMIKLRQEYRIRDKAPYGLTRKGFERWMSERLSEVLGTDIDFENAQEA